MKWVLSLPVALAMMAGAEACTIFVVARNGMVLAGANEDYTTDERFGKHWVRFVPSSDKVRLGYIAFGYRALPTTQQAAINEAGLFFDYNALAKLDRANEGKPLGGVPHLLQMITTCRTVVEAVTYLTQYDLPALSAGQMVLGDATGASAILERHTVTWRSRGTDFQIGTNFRTSTTPKDRIDCERYKTCKKVLERDLHVSVESVRCVLEQTMPKGGGSRTWYTTVADLRSGKVHLFRKGDFSRATVLDVKSELGKGQRTLDMDELMGASAKAYEAKP